MGDMPNWFAKTPEMAAADVYFSLTDAGSEGALVDRYHQALVQLQVADYFSQSKVLHTTTTGKWSPAQATASLQSHFRGDWIHTLYGSDPKYDGIGGRFWPQVRSDQIVQRIRIGTIIAIHKALGRSPLKDLGMADTDIDELFTSERANGVELEGIRPLAMTWNCVASTGEDYFEVDALRGPSVVEFAIATPRPYGHANVMVTVERYELGLLRPVGGESAS